MSKTHSVTWAQLPFAVEEELVALAGRCLAADGGLPLAGDPSFLRRRWLAAGIVSIQGRDADGRLLAAGAARPTSADVGGLTFCGLVDPDARGRGVGTQLLAWGLTQAGSPVTGDGRQAGGQDPWAADGGRQAAGQDPWAADGSRQARGERQLTVETESLTAAAEELFAAHGLRQIFAEDVMRIDLDGGVPEPVWPDGTELAAWGTADAVRFHRVYRAAFRERPGFPGLTAGQWIDDLTEDDHFRPRWSVLAAVPGLGDAGFVTAAVDWIVQVGVAPAARGRGLGGALVAEALRRMRADGATRAWLDVNVDNQAVRLYRRLGFQHRGRRARFRLEGS